MVTRVVRGLAILAVAIIATSAPRPAVADDRIESVQLRFAERRGKLVVKKLGLGSLLFDRKAYNQLKENPLATVIVVRLYVYRKNRSKPLSYQLLSMRIAYDLWTEEYVVRVDGPRGRNSGRFSRLSQAYKKITELDNIPLADLKKIPIGPHHYMALVAELNPVSDETLAEMRRWLTRPAGSTSINRGTSFFGSFVSIFVNAKLPEADRVVRARSQPFYRVARE